MVKTNDLQTQLAASRLCPLSCLHKYLALSHPLLSLTTVDNIKLKLKIVISPLDIAGTHTHIHSGIHLLRKCQQSSVKNIPSDKFSYSSILPPALSDANMKGLPFEGNLLRTSCCNNRKLHFSQCDSKWGWGSICRQCNIANKCAKQIPHLLMESEGSAYRSSSTNPGESKKMGRGKPFKVISKICQTVKSSI